MKAVVTSILTNTSLRDEQAVEQLLMDEAVAGGPWNSVQ